ncbi:MAG: hypothetical protein ONB23_12375 [candidate division KSB1 bacterium]|nr:hypothetical protein [candidate division KSB1 bacterium]
MSCDKIQQILSRAGATEESELPPFVREHLVFCDNCRLFRLRMVALDALLKEWEAPQAPDWLPARIAARIAAEETAVMLPRWRIALERALVPMVVAAGLLLGSLLGAEFHHLWQAAGSEVANGSQASSSLYVDPLSGSFTEAVETVAFADAGGK